MPCSVAGTAVSPVSQVSRLCVQVHNLRFASDLRLFRSSSDDSRVTNFICPSLATTRVELTRSDRKESPEPPYTPPRSMVQGSAPIARRRQERPPEDVHPSSNPCRRSSARSLYRRLTPTGPAARQRTSARLRWNRSGANEKFRQRPVKNRSP